MRPREFWECRLGVCAGLGFWGFCWHELGLDWVAMDCGSCWGVFVWALCGADSFFFGAMVFPPPIFSLPFSFLPVIGGSGVLSHGAVFGFFFPLVFIFFSPRTLRHFLYIEHDIALLHMSTYIAERWHRAHGSFVCVGVLRPHL